MKVHLVKCAVLATVCSLTILSYMIIKKKKKQKKKGEDIIIPKILASELQDTAEYISLFPKHDEQTIPQLPAPRWIKIGTVINLHAYPLVSGKPYDVDECQMKFEGMYMFKNGQLINWDRAFVVYNVETKCIITNNNFPTLREVDLSIDDNYIILQATRMPSLRIKLRDNELVECTYWCCEKVRPFPKIVCTDCGDDAAQWLSKFLWEKDSGFRLGYAINAVGCMGIYWQLVLRNCILYQKARRSKHRLKPCVDVLHSILLSPMSYNNASKVINMFEPNKLICPNIVILTSNFYTSAKWEWIKIGNTIIKNTQPLVEARFSKNPIISNMKLFGLGVNCESYLVGRVKLGDNVYLHIPNSHLMMEDEIPKKTKYDMPYSIIKLLVLSSRTLDINLKLSQQ